METAFWAQEFILIKIREISLCKQKLFVFNFVTGAKGMIKLTARRNY